MDLIADMLTFLDGEVDGDLYGHRIPEGADVPLALVTLVSDRPGTAPQTPWWKTLVSLDVHSTDPGEALAMAQAIKELAPSFVGVHSNSVVTDCQVVSTQPLVDDGWTPTRFRQVVTVALTSREP